MLKFTYNKRNLISITLLCAQLFSLFISVKSLEITSKKDEVNSAPKRINSPVTTLSKRRLGSDVNGDTIAQANEMYKESLDDIELEKIATKLAEDYIANTLKDPSLKQRESKSMRYKTVDLRKRSDPQKKKKPKRKLIHPVSYVKSSMGGPPKSKVVSFSG